MPFLLSRREQFSDDDETIILVVVIFAIVVVVICIFVACIYLYRRARSPPPPACTVDPTVMHLKFMDKTTEREPNSISAAIPDGMCGYWVPALAFVPDVENGLQTGTLSEEGRYEIVG
ncbi:uncharacterized protein EV420DRAFT_1641332 [Desarmillaria tabescens]|uniref:Uncharacterized protein n=1 Tax=Armillaria tabescens TaxID=1929756 RepID=A0AA39KFD2_ARMTA|nr:uncharacterized protein EV420DRAFT_1641332 [Desarmillaria tabescens]KAK0459987.1 hypothetical protein EV420DRAFT_1641332 [Desarmillaria tabescens]